MTERTSYELEVEQMDHYVKTEIDNRVDYRDAQIGPLAFYALGIAGEAGEVADKVKKFYRDGQTFVDGRDIAIELGDVLWYMARMANLLGFSLVEVMELNLKKLRDRHARGKWQGSGDKR